MHMQILWNVHYRQNLVLNHETGDAPTLFDHKSPILNPTLTNKHLPGLNNENLTLGDNATENEIMKNNRIPP